MRIAAVNSLRVSGGGEKWLARLAACWRDRGHHPLILCQPGTEMETLVRTSGLDYRSVVMRHDVSVPGVLGIARVLREFQPHLVLCCNERAFRLTAPATRLAGSPPLVYRNGLTATFKNRSLNRWLFRWAARMVVISEPLREEMASFGWIPPNRLQVIRNGIDTTPYRDDPEARQRIRAELGVSRDAVVAAVLARLTEDKAQLETIQALARIAPEFPEAQLWLAGEGTLLPRLQELVRELRLEDRVRFLGYRRDVPAVLQAVDVVIQASHREGLGNTLLEAMAAGKPMLASAVGGILDVVVPGETGELVPPRDVEALAASLGSLVGDAELRRRYGTAGRRRVEEHFRLEGEVDAWDRLFRELGRPGE